MNKSFTIKKQNVEIFRAGDYGKKGKFTSEDIEAIASSYSKEYLEARITKDHERKGPKYGIVENLIADDGHLYADILISEDFSREIESGSYSDRSIELDFDKDGYYLGAVSFLGAQRPEVRGMEPIRFSDNCKVTPFDVEGSKDGTLHFQMEYPSMETFVNKFPKPEGATNAIVKSQGKLGEILGHCHKFVVDDSGNGFTSIPCYGDDYYDKNWIDGGHQHMLVGGVVQPAEDEDGNAHIHSMPEKFGYYYSADDESVEMQDKTEKLEFEVMPDKTFSQEDFDNLVAENKRIADELEQVKKEKQEYEAQSLAKESEVYASEAYSSLFSAEGGPRILPTQKDGFTATCKLLFSSHGKEEADKYVATFAARPAIVEEGVDGDIKTFSKDSEDLDPEDPASISKAIAKKMVEFEQSGDVPSVALTKARQFVYSQGEDK